MEEVRQEERRTPSKKRSQDHRTPFERDLARLIHSAAFRRLQAKTQVLGIGEGDFHRTRLTHSMETAQIGRGIVKNLKHRICMLPQLNAIKYLPDSDLISCVCLAHDLGHPPFGHGGETALNYCMRRFGGFEANAQTLRILSTTEAYIFNFGLNLTRRSLLGVLKYPANYNLIRRLEFPPDTSRESVKKSDWKPPKCYYDQDSNVFKWIIEPFSIEDRGKYQRIHPPTDNERGKTKEKSLDASIMELSDDIAYGVHDFEDAIVLKLIDKSMWVELQNIFDKSWRNEYELDGITEELFSDSHDSSDRRKRAVGSLVHAFITSGTIEDKDFSDPLLRYRAVLISEAQDALKKLKDFVTDNVIKIPEVQTLEYRGQQIVMQLFGAISSDPERFLKKNFLCLYEHAAGDERKMRVICDYISGMTDDYATRLYERLFLPRHGTVFQRL